MTRALIIGGGVAGAVAALALGKAGISATVYEAYPTGADDIGAFLTIMGNGLDALAAVDARDPVVAESFAAETVEVFDREGRQLGRREIGGGFGAARTLRRAGLYRVLHAELARRGGHLEHGKRLVSATSTDGGGVRARFADGSTAEGDVLIGADGIRSAVRGLINTDPPTPRYTGLNIVYGYAHDPALPAVPAGYRMIYGSGAFFGYTTAPDGSTWWFARLPADELTREELAATGPAQWRQRVVDAVTGDDTPAAAIAAATGDDVDCRNAYDIPTTPVWWTPPAVLVGDAAHAASPAAGQGASMALEDAVVLAKCLRDLPDPERAFASYERLRRARVEALVDASAAMGNAAAAGAGDRLRTPTWDGAHHIDWDTPVTD
jgi:2-polyprenyl-6-methoxyphenol hydroxylase-like FAD-dependent oxidoreductase